LKDKSVINTEEIKDNVKYVQGILLLSGCKEMYKIQENNIFLQKKHIILHNPLFYICGIQIINLILQFIFPLKH